VAPGEPDAARVSPNRTDGADPVPVAIGQPRGHASAILIALLVVIFAAGSFGRLVPGPRPQIQPGTSPNPPVASSGPAMRLVSPIAGVLWLRSTEIFVRGIAPSGVRRIDVSVRIGGQPNGQAFLDVGAGRQFDGLVPITPPARRTAAVLELRAAGRSDILAAVAFPVEAGALLLPSDPSGLHGRAGGVLIVDVIVYGGVRELRGLLTGVNGDLIATGVTILPGPGSVRAGSPRTVAIELKIPVRPLPGRARLHLLGIDPDGIEVEHIDANVALSGE
jgi:hypothetical protein